MVSGVVPSFKHDIGSLPAIVPSAIEVTFKLYWLKGGVDNID